MKKITFLLVMLLGLISVYAQNKQTQAPVKSKDVPVYISSVEGIHEYKLKNGLQILLIPDPTQSNVIVNIVYHVGSRYEGYGEKGMAHLLEHMMFKSTKNLGSIKQMLSDKGGNANGTTYFDRTNYFEIFPSNEENLRWSLQMEADRMINCTMLQSDLDKEFSVVRNEFEIGENDPGNVLYERILSTAYLWHNYGNSTIGSKEDIERVKANRLKLFYQKYYQPDNATLIVAGKFDEMKVLAQIEEYFAPILRPKRELEQTYTIEPAQDGQRYVELRRAGDQQLVAAAYHTAALADTDAAPLEALSEILTSDPSGYLYKALIDTHTGSSIWSYQTGLRDPGYMYFNMEVPKDKSLDDGVKSFLSELDKISSIPYTEQDVARAKAKLIKSLDDQKNNTISFAINLTEIIGAGDYRLWFLNRDAIEKLSLADVQRVAQRYFKITNRTYGVFIPSKNEQRVKPDEFMDEDIIKLTSEYKGKTQTEENASFDATIDNVKKNLTVQTLPVGLKYALITKPVKGKKVVALFRFPVGNLEALTGKRMVASLMASMLKAGTNNLTKEQIQDKLDQMKTQIDFYFDRQDLMMDITTYQEFLTSAFDIVHQLLSESVFPDNEITKTITEAKTNKEASKNDPMSVVFTEIDHKTTHYPKDHPFYASSPDEDIAALNAVTRDQIVTFYQTLLGADHGVGTIVGDIDPAIATKSVTEAFGDWRAKSSYEKILPTYFATSADSEKIITPDKENAAVVGTIAFKMDFRNPDYPAMVMANEMLGQGGFLTARIPTRLREKEGISYGAGSYQIIPRDNQVARWNVYAFFNPKVQEKVDAAIKEEIQKANANGFSAEELKSNIEGWLNSRKTALGNDNTLISIVNDVLYYGNPIDDWTKLENNVKALKVDEINAAMRKYIVQANLVLVYAGDFNKK
jgi:zinc protease